MPPLETIVETSLYADDLDACTAFYRDVLGLLPWGAEPGRHAFFLAGDRMLLLFRPQATLAGGILPAHGSTGPGHVALGIASDALQAWRSHLVAHGVAIEKEIAWPLGGKSLYFRDPAGNSVELLTRGVWGSPAGW